MTTVFTTGISTIAALLLLASPVEVPAEGGPASGAAAQINYDVSWITVASPERASDPTENMKWREADKVVPYGETPQGPLSLYILEPPVESEQKKNRPAIVFFHGGGWNTGNARGFYWQSNYLSTLGIVCINVQYRIKSIHGTTPLESTYDAVRAMQFVRAHAAEWNIDPERIAVSGGSAGGHLAAACATLKGFEDAEFKTVSPRPNALILFNPAVDLMAIKSERHRGKEKEIASISPFAHLDGKQPPTIIYNGAKDKTTTLERACAYAKKMQELGNQCEVVVYPEAGHSFFHRKRGTRMYFADTLTRTEAFLRSLGWVLAD
jgi:acetyl esterase/lipase